MSLIVNACIVKNVGPTPAEGSYVYEANVGAVIVVVVCGGHQL